MKPLITESTAPSYAQSMAATYDEGAEEIGVNFDTHDEFGALVNAVRELALDLLDGVPNVRALEIARTMGVELDNDYDPKATWQVVAAEALARLMIVATTEPIDRVVVLIRLVTGFARIL